MLFRLSCWLGRSRFVRRRASTFLVAQGLLVWALAAVLATAGGVPADDAALWSDRALEVRDAVAHAWRGYRAHAGGHDDLRPLSRSGHDWLNARASFFDSLDTLYLVGLHEEYNAAVEEVLGRRVSLSAGVAYPTNVFEYELRVVGGLAGAYALSGDRRLLAAARVAADSVLDAVDAQTRLLHPRARLEPWLRPLHWLAARALDHLRARVAPQPCGSLAVIGSFGPAFRFLSRETGDPRYASAVNAALATVASGWVHFDGGRNSRRLLVSRYETQPPLREAEAAAPQQQPPTTAAPTKLDKGQWKPRKYTRAQPPQRCFGGRGLGSGADSFYEGLAKEQLLQQPPGPAGDADDTSAATDAAVDAGSRDSSRRDGDDPVGALMEAFDFRPAPELSEAEVAAYPAAAVHRAMYGWLAEGLRTHGFGVILHPRADVAANARNATFGEVPVSPGAAFATDGGALADHLACYLPGVLALGASAASMPDHGEADLKLAGALMRGCMDMYTQAPGFNEVGLGPDAVVVDTAAGTVRAATGTEARAHLLRPEAVESAFVLFRATGRPEYREFGWRVFRNLQAHARVASGGYTGLRDVSSTAGQAANGDDDMPSYFVAETLKYLYLLFSDAALLPLDDWVFTTEAHPLSRRPRCELGSRGAGGSGGTGHAWQPPGCTGSDSRLALMPWPWEPALLAAIVWWVVRRMRQSRRLCCRTCCCLARPWTWRRRWRWRAARGPALPQAAPRGGRQPSTRTHQ